MSDLDPAHVEAICEAMHDAYEFYAVACGWETNHASRKPWSDVPDANRETMRAAVRAVLASTDPDVHAALLAVPAVREALANAWDEGFDAWPIRTPPDRGRQ